MNYQLVLKFFKYQNDLFSKLITSNKVKHGLQKVLGRSSNIAQSNFKQPPVHSSLHPRRRQFQRLLKSFLRLGSHWHFGHVGIERSELADVASTTTQDHTVFGAPPQRNHALHHLCLCHCSQEGCAHASTLEPNCARDDNGHVFSSAICQLFGQKSAMFWESLSYFIFTLRVVQPTPILCIIKSCKFSRVRCPRLATNQTKSKSKSK